MALFRYATYWIPKVTGQRRSAHCFSAVSLSLISAHHNNIRGLDARRNASLAAKVQANWCMTWNWLIPLNLVFNRVFNLMILLSGWFSRVQLIEPLESRRFPRTCRTVNKISFATVWANQFYKLLNISFHKQVLLLSEYLEILKSQDNFFSPKIVGKLIP